MDGSHRPSTAPSPTPSDLIQGGDDVLNTRKGPGSDRSLWISGFEGTQPYKIVIFEEKSSLEPILTPVADAVQADLYLGKGEPSETMVHKMATVAEADGRPMVILTFCDCDCDPSGWQMPISIARKLMGHQVRDVKIEFQVRRIGLTPDQVRAHNLPDSPLKEKERRANAWQEATGIAQTEIDALRTLHPDVLLQLARDAVRPFYDSGLTRRVTAARAQWCEEAQQSLDAQLDQRGLQRLRAEAEERLGELCEEIDRLNEVLQLDASEFDLPAPVIPTAELGGYYPPGLPLLDSRWSFVEQTERLIEDRSYAGLHGAGLSGDES